jgi:dTDP-4-dehydrorhamnose reductase
MKRILVTGASGQVGTEVSRLTWPRNTQICTPSRYDLDISDQKSVAAYFAAMRPQCVINLAAYTAVDRAETDVAAAFLVNAQGAAFVAEAARLAEAPIIHVSTDYVFNGSASTPYCEADATRPLNAYGASKLAGELAVRACNARSIVVRTAWVVSAYGANFIKTMLRLAETTPELRIVDDQRGSPTSASDIAASLQMLAMRAIEDPKTPWGIYHFVNRGETSWFGLAEHIFSWRAARGRARPRVRPISTADFPRPALRPAYSHLDTRLIEGTFGIQPRPWEQAIDSILEELAATEHEQGGVP